MHTQPTETEPELCLIVSRGGTGQQQPAAGISGQNHVPTQHLIHGCSADQHLCQEAAQGLRLELSEMPSCPEGLVLTGGRSGAIACHLAAQLGLRV